MSARCLFGIFVFAPNSSVVYRFLTDDLYEHLLQVFRKRNYKLSDDLTDDEQNDNNDDTETLFSFDDAISQHLSILIRVHEDTLVRHDPIRRIRLETGVQVFFDQITENTVVCMADESFDTIVVLKTLNLLKALIKFHIGALPFMNYNVADQLINRISASLQYFLSNITANQALLFESCEHLLVNTLIREQCREVCSMMSTEVQNMIKVPRKIILVKCNDKIVHMHISTDQSRPNNADLFLLLLNDTSRSYRKDFEAQTSKSSIIAHRYERKLHQPSLSSQSNSTRSSTDSVHFIPSDRAQSCPNFTTTESNTSREKSKGAHRSEVVFLKTSNRAIAPFTLFTIPLVNQMTVLILIEWEESTVCSNLYSLIRHLDSSTLHGLFSYSTLKPLVQAVESSVAVRRYLEQTGDQANILSDIFNRAYALHRSSSKSQGDTDQRHRSGLSVVRHLTDMSRLSSDIFRRLFFDSDEYARRCGVDTKEDEKSDVQMEGVGQTETKFRKNEYDISPMTKLLRKKIILKLADWFSFIEVKSQRNITMNFCHNDFPGLVHFVFIDRSRGQICTPTLIPDDPLQQQAFHNPADASEYFLERKIFAFELECFSTLQQGFTSYTKSDEHFTYNYTLRLQESNGASMRLYKSFVQSQSPSVLHVDFYKALAEEYYPWLTHQSSIACYELISVHLRVVPPNVVREQCERLWPKLMEPLEQIV